VQKYSILEKNKLFVLKKITCNLKVFAGFHQTNWINLCVFAFFASFAFTGKSASAQLNFNAKNAKAQRRKGLKS